MPDPTYTFGQNAGNAVNPRDDTGQILTQIAANTQDAADDGSGSSDPVWTTPKQSSTPPSTFTPVTADGPAVTIAAGEKGFIQNLDDAAVYVKYGAGASSTSFNYVLKAGTAANDGLGGVVVIDDWIGVVSIAAATGSPRVAAWKI